MERALILLSLPVLCSRPSPHLSHQGVLSHPLRHEWEGRKCESRKVLTWWVFLLSCLCAPQTCSVFKADCLSGGWFHVFFRKDLLLEVPLIQLRQALQFGLLELCRIFCLLTFLCFYELPTRTGLRKLNRHKSTGISTQLFRYNYQTILFCFIVIYFPFTLSFEFQPQCFEFKLFFLKSH